MTAKEIETKLIAILHEYQTRLPEPETGIEITPDVRPVLDLPQFDSHCGVEMTVECFLCFNIEDDNSVQSLFVEDRKALSINETAKTISELMKKAGVEE